MERNPMHSPRTGDAGAGGWKWLSLAGCCALLALPVHAMGDAGTGARDDSPGARTGANEAATLAEQAAAPDEPDGRFDAPAPEACAQVPFASDAEAIAGHYYLSGIREVGSELLLRGDGSFQWMLAYGAEDRSAHGRWWRNGDCVGLAEAEAGDERPFVLMQPGDSDSAKEMYDELHKYGPEADRDRLVVYVVELVHGMSTDGVEVALRWEDGVKRSRRLEFPKAVFDPRRSRPVAVGLRWAGQGGAFEWIEVGRTATWPLVVEARLAPLMGAAPIPRRLRIDGDGLVPTWPGQGERGQYSRD